MRTRTQPFLGALLLVVTSAPSVLAAPAPFEPTPAFDLQLSFPDPGKTADRLRGAIASLQRGDTTRAMSEARAVLKDDPGSANAHEVIGSVAMLKRDWAEAERVAADMVKTEADWPSAHFLMGIVKLDQGKVSDALPLLQKAWPQVSRGAWTQLTTAVTHRTTGNLTESLRLLEQVTKDKRD